MQDSTCRRHSDLPKWPITEPVLSEKLIEQGDRTWILWNPFMKFNFALYCEKWRKQWRWLDVRIYMKLVRSADLGREWWLDGTQHQTVQNQMWVWIARTRLTWKRGVQNGFRQKDRHHFNSCRTGHKNNREDGHKLRYSESVMSLFRELSKDWQDLPQNH
jgi:hypothetical protein